MGGLDVRSTGGSVGAIIIDNVKGMYGASGGAREGVYVLATNGGQVCRPVARHVARRVSR